MFFSRNCISTGAISNGWDQLLGTLSTSSYSQRIMAEDKKLTKKSDAVRYLHSLFEKKIITGKEDPKAVFLMSSLFQRHKLSNFRTCYNQIRREFFNLNSKY